MGSSHFGEPTMQNGRFGSSRKGKKSNSDKPKQPQRGLGVAELEKIRLNSQMNSNTNYLPSFHTPYNSNLNQGEDIRMETSSSSSVSSSSSSLSSFYTSPSYGFHPNMMMGFREKEANSQSSTTSRWNHNNNFFESTKPSMTGELFSLTMEDSIRKKRIQDRNDSSGSTGQNSDSSDTQEQELDLDLRL